MRVEPGVSIYLLFLNPAHNGSSMVNLRVYSAREQTFSQKFCAQNLLSEKLCPRAVYPKPSL